jgi:DnaJ-class molecular chaperone
MGLSPQVTTCRNCHENHHEPARDCTTCHTGYDIRARHEPEVEASHQRCDACHTTGTVQLLLPNRSFCSTCHAEQKADHHSGRECTVCHLLSEPLAWKRRLISGGAR